MEHFGLAPGRLIGDLKRALEEAIERGEMESHRDAAYYLEGLEAQGLSPKAGGTPGGRPA
jgi:poly(A) polymerase